MAMPGLSFLAMTASAIFMKNCDISVSDRLIFLPCTYKDREGATHRSVTGSSGQVSVPLMDRLGHIFNSVKPE